MKRLLVVLTFTIFPATSFANKPAYTVGVEAIPFLPYSDSPGGEYTGLFKDIIEAFATAHNLDVKFRPLPVTRLYAEFFSGKLDFKVPSNKYWKGDKKKEKGLEIIYSDRIVSYTDGVFVKKGNENRGIKKLKKMGIVAGFTPWGYQEYIKAQQITVKENPSLEGLLQQAILGRVDGIYINKAVGEYYLKNSLKKPGSLILDKNLPFKESGYHLSTIKHGNLIKKFNKFLKQSGVIKKLVKKYDMGSN